MQNATIFSYILSYILVRLASKYLFCNILHLNQWIATNLFKMLLKYRPEDNAEKKERLLKRAQAEVDGKSVETKKPIVVKYGLNHVTYLIEQVLLLL